MCGICGKLNLKTGIPIQLSLIKSMMNVMVHRGPDDEGVYITDQVALGHRRLSIIDLNTGKQPISNEDQTVWVVFNGEIYNYKELRDFLLQKGHFFKTCTDTEVLVHLYEEFGDEMVSKLRGMFAFAIWDSKENILLIARDRVGIKPLYYCLTNDSILFASEMKSILEDPAVRKDINRPAVDIFMQYMFLPGDTTLIKSIKKLNPGYLLTCKHGKVSIKQYWDLTFPESRYERSFSTAMTDIRTLLRETVKYHMISDVPVGFLLSGGIDSTAMLSFAVEDAGMDISTFTLGFDSTTIVDERPYARLAAAKYGTKHHEMTITASDFLGFLPKYVWHMEEPVCDPSAIALYFISKLARDHVKVLISGEGGDEAFAGYQTYRNIVWLERLKRTLGRAGKQAMKALGAMNSDYVRSKYGKYIYLMDVPFDKYYYSRKTSPYSYRTYTDLYTKDYLQSLDKTKTDFMQSEYLNTVAGRDYLSKMLYIDTKTYLPNDLLVKADKITMANSIELRVPLLDHQVLEFAAALPSSYKLHGFSGKYILKKALAKRVPKEILYRKKTGFPTPFGTWLQKDLKTFVEDVLLSKSSIERGYFRKEGLHQLVRRNADTGKYPDEIFSLLNLELWHQIFIENKNH